MKYFVLAYYLVSYSMGFVAATLLFLRWHRTREAAFRSLLLFLVSFAFFNLNYDAAYLLGTVLGRAALWSSLGFLGLSALFFSWFNFAIVEFTHTVTGVASPRARWAARGVALLPLVVFAVEAARAAAGGSSDESRVLAREGLEIVTLGFLVYNSAVFFLRRHLVPTPFFRALVRFIVGLNVFFFPLFVGELLLNFHLEQEFPPVTLTNAYFFVGSLVTAVLVFRHEFAVKATPVLPAASSPGVVLTDREREIVDLLAQGLSNKEIGARLFIEASTVKNHLYRIYQRTGSRSRVDLLNKMRARQ